MLCDPAVPADAPPAAAKVPWLPPLAAGKIILGKVDAADSVPSPGLEKKIENGVWLLDGKTTVGYACSLPVRWDGVPEPRGLDWAMSNGAAGDPTTLCAVVVALQPSHRGQGLSELILRAFLLRHSILTQIGSGLTLIGSRFAPDTRRLLEVFARNRLAPKWLDLESSPDAETMLRRALDVALAGGHAEQAGNAYTNLLGTAAEDRVKAFPDAAHDELGGLRAGEFT